MKCVICVKANATVPVNDKAKKYCQLCWKKRCDAHRIIQEKFSFDRYIRAPDAEIYFLRFPESGEPSVGTLILVRDDNELFHAYLLLNDKIKWNANAVKLSEGDEPYGHFDALSDVVADVVGGWGGGKILLEIHLAAEKAQWEMEV